MCEGDKTDSKPLERKKSVPFDKLILSIAMGSRDEDSLSSLAGRLARLDKQLDEKERMKIEEAADGMPLNQIINKLLDAIILTNNWKGQRRSLRPRNSMRVPLFYTLVSSLR